MGAGYDAKLLGTLDSDESHEILEIDAVSPPGLRVTDIGELLGLGRHLGQSLEFLSGQSPGLYGRKVGRGHGKSSSN